MNGKRFLLAVPLIILATSISLAENYRQMSIAESRSDGQSLQMLGYNYNRQLIQLTVSLWNKGDTPITITDVYYDGERLTKGLVGSAVDPTIVSSGAGSGPSNGISTNDLIFAATDQWNMDTMDSSNSTVGANGVTTLYLGVTSTTPGSEHSLEIVAGGERYTFSLKFEANHL